MKSFTRIMIIMLVFCLSIGSSQMFGQNSRSDKIIVTQKIETEDGQIIVKKKALDSPEDVEAFISQIKESVATEQLDAQLKGIKIQHEGEEDAFFFFF